MYTILHSLSYNMLKANSAKMFGTSAYMYLQYLPLPLIHKIRTSTKKNAEYTRKEVQTADRMLP